MLGAASTGALVSGGAKALAEAVADLRVLRAFIWQGARQEPGALLPQIGLRDAQQLVAWGKAVIVPPAELLPASPAPASSPARPASSRHKETAA